MADINGWLRAAFSQHQNGNLEAAEPLYRKILRKQPLHIDALYLLGTLCNQKGDNESAIEYLQRAVNLKPGHAQAQNNLGNALGASGRGEEALAAYERAIAIQPDYAQPHVNLGNALRAQGRPDLAEARFRRALELVPGHAQAHNGLGNALLDQGRTEAAEASYRQAIALQPDFAEAFNNLGVLLKSRERYDEAAESIRRALSAAPDHVPALSNLGAVHEAQERFEEAEAGHRRAVALRPDDPQAHYNLGNALMAQDKNEAALEAYDRAMQLAPNYAEAHNNRGFLLGNMLRVEESLESLDRALTLSPRYADAHWNRSLTLLMAGDYERGWPEYEWRFQLKTHKPRGFVQPQWNGEPLDCRTIFVWTEQGVGDAFQFVRYLPMVQRAGGRVVFECPRGALTLLQRFDGMDALIERASDAPPAIDFDLHVPLMSLPAIFKTTLETVPNAAPYLHAHPDLTDKWRNRISRPPFPPNLGGEGGAGSSIRIGLVWAGNPKHKNDRRRSCALADFAPLAETPGAVFFSLQKGEAAKQAANPPPGMTLRDLSEELTDFAETAAALANLDLVISVDTSVAHLAGAMGRPVWTLLPFAPDFRWLLDREDTPWYPSMRLFRQTQPGDWPDVFARVAAELRAQQRPTALAA